MTNWDLLRRPEDVQQIAERWIERHGVNCYFCNVLFDERESVGTTPDGGDVCEECTDQLAIVLLMNFTQLVSDFFAGDSASHAQYLKEQADNVLERVSDTGKE